SRGATSPPSSPARSAAPSSHSVPRRWFGSSGRACVALGPPRTRTGKYVQSQLVKGRHATIEVYSGGSGETIVMLPSLGRGASDFFEIAEKLMARGYRVLLPEPRGIGRSTGEMEHLTLHDLAGDVADVIEAEGGAPAVIC